MNKPKFNLMDGLILALVVAVIAGAILIFGGSGNSGETAQAQNTTAMFKIQLTKAEKSLYDKFFAALEAEEPVWIGVKERFEGKIESLELSPSEKVAANLYTGKAVLAQDPNVYDITISVSASAVEDSSSISASGTPIRVGEEVAIRGKGFAGYGFVTDLQTISE